MPSILEKFPPAKRLQIYYLRDVASSHFIRNVTQYLNERFPGRWIGRCDSHDWPPRSPVFSPLDFRMWGYMKNKMDNIDELLQWILMLQGDLMTPQLFVCLHIPRSNESCFVSKLTVVILNIY